MSGSSSIREIDEERPFLLTFDLRETRRQWHDAHRGEISD